MLVENLQIRPKDIQINIEPASPQLVQSYVNGIRAVDSTRIPSEEYARVLAGELQQRSVLLVKPPTESGFDLTIALFGLEGKLVEITQEPDRWNSLQQMSIFCLNDYPFSISAQYVAHPFTEYLNASNKQHVIYRRYTADFGFVNRDPWGQSGSYGCSMLHKPVSSLSKGEFTITKATLVGTSSQMNSQLFRKYSEEFDLHHTPFTPLLIAHNVQPVSFNQ